MTQISTVGTVGGHSAPVGQRDIRRVLAVVGARERKATLIPPTLGQARVLAAGVSRKSKGTVIVGRNAAGVYAAIPAAALDFAGMHRGVDVVAVFNCGREVALSDVAGAMPTPTPTAPRRGYVEARPEEKAAHRDAQRAMFGAVALAGLSREQDGMLRAINEFFGTALESRTEMTPAEMEQFADAVSAGLWLPGWVRALELD